MKKINNAKRNLTMANFKMHRRERGVCSQGKLDTRVGLGLVVRY